MVNIFLLIITLICVLAMCALVYLIIRQFDRQQQEWNAERAKLLDRIQAGSLNEYKAQERASEKRDTPEKTESDREKDRIRGLTWA